MYIGGLLGSNQGTITDCYNFGNITFEEVEINSRYLRLGGLVGINEGAAAILRSTNHGAIILAGSNGTSQHNYIGGIVGQTDGAISECVNNGAISGTFKSSYHKVGGIVGYVSSNAASDIVGNTNQGNITQYIPDADRVFVGGIAGHVIELKSKFERNTNSASVSMSNGTSYVYVGGCIGWLQKAITGTFKNNSVTNNVAVTCTSASLTTGVGGLIGSSNDGAVIDLAGDMGVIAPIVTGGNSASVDNHVGVGGIVGFANNKVTVKNVTNWTGTINADQSIRTNANCVGFGGIFGYASDGVLIENCTSDGNLTTNIPENFAGRFAFGGIIGMCKGACEFTYCTNNTVLSLSAQPKNRSNDAPIYIGGIIGWGISGDITIKQCNNTKGFNNKGHNCRVISNDSTLTSHQTANYTGGIIGAYGVNAAEGALNISDCSSVGDLTSFAGAVGGIAGYVRNATITKCTNSQSLITSGGITGGIVAHASDSKISNCISKCNTSGTVNRGSIPHTGGIVGLVHGRSSIEGCSFFGQLAFTDANNKARYGAISGYTSDNSVVRNNTFGGVVCNNVISDSNFSDYTANVLNTVENSTDVNPTIEENNSYWDGN